MTRPVLSPLRRDRITASRLPVLLGQSPYGTPKTLMREMVRDHFGDPQEFVGNIVTDWGHTHEADAVIDYEMTRGVQVKHAGTGQLTLVHPDLDFLAATPDGLTVDRVVECKAPWRSLYTSIEDRPDYQIQMRLQMEVTGMPAADLAVWRPDKPLIIDTIVRDPGWLDRVLPTIEEFMAQYRATLADPEKFGPHREPLKDVRVDVEWSNAAAEWLEIDYLMDQLAARKDAAGIRLASLAPDKSARGGGLDLLRYDRKANVQWKRALADLQVTVDEDKYRGAPSKVLTIRRISTK